MMCSRVWHIEEIRSAIFEALDQASLAAAVCVCRAWFATGARLVWRYIWLEQLGFLSFTRQHAYERAIRSLFVRDAAAVDYHVRGWRFPQLRQLILPPAIVQHPSALSALLTRCGPELGSVVICTLETTSSAYDVHGSAEGDVGNVVSEQQGEAGSNAVSDGIVPAVAYVTAVAFDPLALKLLAASSSIRELAVDAPALITREAIDLVGATIFAPFSHLCYLAACVNAADAPALITLLARAQRPVSALTLTVNVDAANRAMRNAVLHALARNLPGLRSLALSYAPPLALTSVPFAYLPPADQQLLLEQLPPDKQLLLQAQAATRPALYTTVLAGDNMPGAADSARAFLDRLADDFGCLRRLHELTSLTVDGAYFHMDEAQLYALLSGLPRLEQLALHDYVVLPSSALLVAGECCRVLRHIELDMLAYTPDQLDGKGAYADALKERRPSGGGGGCLAAAMPFFPELRTLRLALPWPRPPTPNATVNA
jgi:hypothetical protein